MEKKPSGEESMIDQFIKDTPVWYEQMERLKITEHCPICGIAPVNIVKLIEEIKALKTTIT